MIIAVIRFLKSRLKFVNRALPSWNNDGTYKLSPAPFPSMIVVFKNKQFNNLNKYA